jgi:4-amino-4-deoxy-L-arabinose transferase-like glycosyltransferase
MPARYFGLVVEMSERSGRIALAVIMLLGLVVRIGWGIRQPSGDAAINALPDQREYLDLGNHLRQGELWFSDARFRQTVYAYRTPGYPALVAMCGAEPVAVRIVQSLLDTSGILAIFLLARRWLPVSGALLAAFIVALNPYLIFFSGLILSETLFTAMLCWGLALLVLSDGRRIWYFGGAILLALSVLVRPGAIGIPVVLGCGAALATRRSVRPFPVAATMVLLTFLVLFSWAARNRWKLGAWVWTSTNDGITRYDGFNPDATGASNQNFVDSMPWTRDVNEIARSRYFARLADDWIAENRWETIKLAGIKLARTWSPMPLSREYGGRPLYRWGGLAFEGIFDVLIFIGLSRSGLPGPAKRLLLLPLLYFTVAAMLSVGSLRYRLPAEGPMAIIAAGAFAPARRP